MTFILSFIFLMFLEGEISNVKEDRGGLTKYGLTEVRYPELDIANLTPCDAMEVYKRDFWDRFKIESYPEKYRFIMFDMTVNHGSRNANKTLQRAINAKIGFSKRQRELHIPVDGVVGKKTMTALNRYKPELFRIAAYRSRFFNKIIDNDLTQEVFRAGWFNRIIKINDMHKGVIDVTEEHVRYKDSKFSTLSIMTIKEIYARVEKIRA